MKSYLFKALEFAAGVSAVAFITMAFMVFWLPGILLESHYDKKKRMMGCR